MFESKAAQEKQETAAIALDAVHKALELEHGPLVVIGFRDGSLFAFRRMGREQFTTRQNRVRRGESEADDMLLQERCVWPSREAWNSYVATAALETLSYSAKYSEAHGGGKVHEADPDEVPENAKPGVRWLSGNGKVFGFRKPERAEIKRFKSMVMAEAKGDKGPTDPIEWLLGVLSDDPASFKAWLEENLFAIHSAGSFGDTLAGVLGMGEATIDPKL